MRTGDAPSKERDSLSTEDALRRASDMFPEFLDDGNVPLAITVDPAEMQILESLSTYKAQSDQPRFVPVPVEVLVNGTARYDFGALSLEGKEGFSGWYWRRMARAPRSGATLSGS